MYGPPVLLLHFKSTVVAAPGDTMTVSDAGPNGPVHARVYEIGTVIGPCDSPALLVSLPPTKVPPEAVQLVMLEVVHDSVTFDPESTTHGPLMSLHRRSTTGTAAALTNTVTLSEVLPPATSQGKNYKSSQF